MTWVEVEEAGESWVLIAGVAGLISGTVAWWHHGFLVACFAYLGGGFVLLLAHELWLELSLPWEARRAANLVLAWFRGKYPNERVESIAVRAIEVQRYVIAVRHGFGFPTPRRYFTIERANLAQIAELSVADWWPRGLK